MQQAPLLYACIYTYGKHAHPRTITAGGEAAALEAQGASMARLLLQHLLSSVQGCGMLSPGQQRLALSHLQCCCLLQQVMHLGVAHLC